MEQTCIFVSLSVEELLDRLTKCKLLSAEELAQAASASKSAVNGNALARDLLGAGHLTSYQMQALCDGNYSQLRIGSYDVLDRLGAGGMGTVFKARHRRMKRIVALKVLSRSLASDESFVRRFQREVETIARLSHPNIVVAYDADEDEMGPYLVMEFVDGLDLASLVEKQGPLPVSVAVNCVLQTARGLEYAHNQGIIHRDIKPANLLRDAGGTVKLTDLGLARLNASTDPAATSAEGSITQAGGVMGTVDYMSPEQAVDSTSIDHRADIYSLGATLYFLLVGQPPYQGNSMMATLLKHRETPIPSLAAARKDVPTSLDAIFRRMVAKAPADRFQTMSEAVAALKSVLGDLGGEAETSPGGKRFPIARPVTRVSAGTGGSETRTSSPAKTMPQTIEPSPADAAPTAPSKVLLVEPSRTQSGIIRKYLQDQGVQHVVTAASGREALPLVESERPEAVVSALHLSDMTGVQLAERIRAERKGAGPGFVLMSSEGGGSEAGTLSKCGKAIVLQKPFTPEGLVEALRLVSVAQPPVASAPARGKLRVLIVDDSAPARRHIRGVLTGLGLSEFVEAADGAQAVAAVAVGSWDLIVTDYNMPYMDGRGLVGYLKHNPATAATPIIMVTTEQDPVKLEEVRRLGVAAICDKSFPPEIVGKILDQLGTPS